MKPVTTMRAAVASLFVLAAFVAVALTSAQGPFDASSFAFQQYQEYTGSISLRPKPSLYTAGGTFLLTRPGKFGAEPWLRQWDGQAVRLRGALIQSGGDRMLEIEAGSIGKAALSAAAEPSVEDLGPIELRGEIADAKCYLGVMNPGRGKVHRDCAVRCISGGAPAVLLARDAAGRLRVVLLPGIGREVLPFVGEPVRLRGQLQRQGEQLILAAEPARLRRE